MQEAKGSQRGRFGPARAAQRQSAPMPSSRRRAGRASGAMLRLARRNSRMA
jgi:hypothetical protein